MVSSHGFRRQTRKRFRQPYKKHGMPNPSTYLRTYKKGDYVDIVVNPAIHKGMPHKYYHGMTGRVLGVNKRSLLVIMSRLSGNQKIERRILVRIEHCRPSRCREDFEKRVALNQKLRMEAAEKGEKVVIMKRLPEGPRPEFVVKLDNVEELSQLQAK
ncbi:60S ribosomal protein L21-2 [Dictyocoela muelleri]|nr:60S ribosomal protein L21-2 [Dictyocoela muelleri]